jgi:hypothetical protein
MTWKAPLKFKNYFACRFAKDASVVGITFIDELHIDNANHFKSTTMRTTTYFAIFTLTAAIVEGFVSHAAFATKAASPLHAACST